MEWVIKQAKVYDVHSPLNGGCHTLWVRAGTLYKVDEPYPKDIPCITGEQLAVSPAWFDLRAHCCDPGQEHKEDLQSGLSAAAAGGFSEVALLPDTQPALQFSSQLPYLFEKARSTGVKLQAVGALTRDQAGKQLTELLDMLTAGVRAFSDGAYPLNNLRLLTQALRYLRPFNGLIMHRAENASLAQGCMHEGPVSTALGLPSIPAYAEQVMVYNALQALQHAGGRLHFSCISVADSVKLIREAGMKGLQVSADVAVHQLLFEEQALQDFSTVHRVAPPYRSAADRRALRKAVAMGHIQAIVSDHSPHTLEDKMQPFAEAAAGVISLQCVLPILLRIQKYLPLEASLKALYDGPRRVFGLPVPTIRLNEPVCFTVFDTAARWRFDTHTNYSKSTNSPFYGQELVGQVLAVLNGKRNLLSRL